MESKPIIVGIESDQLTDEEEELLREYKPFGVIVFSRNISTVERFIYLTRKIKALSNSLIFVDAEGGKVFRFAKFFNVKIVGAQELRKLQPNWSYIYARSLGKFLRTLSVDVNLAPVLDIDHGKKNNALDERYLGGDCKEVVSRGLNFIKGLKEEGILCCGKHFPGLGYASEDTHVKKSVVDVNMQQIRLEIEPFCQLSEHMDFVMVAHSIYPAIDNKPATLSNKVVKFLREFYNGFVITDDFTMKALLDFGEVSDLALHSIEAGFDAISIQTPIAQIANLLDRLPSRRFDLSRFRLPIDDYLTQFSKINQKIWQILQEE